MRLLFCNHCKSLEEIPDYDGDAEVDPLIEEVVRQHNVRAPMEHGGANLTASPMRIAVVDDLEWAMDREKIIKQINESNKKVGFDAWVSEAHNTYGEDALKCWHAHREPGEGKPCIDYWSDSKRIGRPTAEGRVVLKENPKLSTDDPHLCQWCPYYTHVMTEVRHKKGMYKD